MSTEERGFLMLSLLASWPVLVLMHAALGAGAMACMDALRRQNASTWRVLLGGTGAVLGLMLGVCVLWQAADLAAGLLPGSPMQYLPWFVAMPLDTYLLWTWLPYAALLLIVPQFGGVVVTLAARHSAGIWRMFVPAGIVTLVILIWAIELYSKLPAGSI